MADEPTARCSVVTTTDRALAVSSSSSPLARLETARRLLADVRSVDDAKAIHDFAEAARVYARQARLGLEAQNDAAEIRLRAEKNERVLVTTLTKRMAEDLAEYYTEVGVKCRYLHSEVETLDRIKILRGLRRGEFDVLIGINLLREGLDLPEVSLVAILDADKEGFLRSGDSLIQTMGRAARHINGRAILYADKMTDSMKRAIGETNRRREIQTRYNEENNITPESIIKPVDMTLVAIAEADYVKVPEIEVEEVPTDDPEKVAVLIARLETEMREAARKFEFERAAELRDKARELRAKVL